ncbi:MAG TPA: serine/threonine-protein kinase, partial [Gemmatimonadaceae bacterium]
MTRDRHLEPDDWERLAALWETASALPPDQRDEMLRSHAIDGALRDELESLLARASVAEAFFDRLHAVVSDTAHMAAASGRQPAQLGADPLLESTVGHYRIDARLGQGGMGIVYRATDLRLRRTVALKLLRTQSPDDPRAKERLLAEARAAAALDNANICTIYEVGETAEQVPFIAMAFYSGETLEQVLHRGPLPIATAIDYATQIARGLGAAHQRGIIHRDIKPANVVVTADGVLKLLDFGIARNVDVGASHDGVTPGTIAYMSPEQVTSRAIDPRSDLWSLGIVLYEMCTGARPFGGEHAGAILYAILHESPPPANTLRPEIPGRVASIIERLLAKDPAQRHNDAEELISDLTSPTRADVRTPRTRRPRRALWLAAAVLGVGALAA